MSVEMNETKIPRENKIIFYIIRNLLLMRTTIEITISLTHRFSFPFDSTYAWKAPYSPADPPMSIFMPHIPSRDLIARPPVSKMMPLPTWGCGSTRKYMKKSYQ